MKSFFGGEKDKGLGGLLLNRFLENIIGLKCKTRFLPDPYRIPYHNLSNLYLNHKMFSRHHGCVFKAATNLRGFDLWYFIVRSSSKKQVTPRVLQVLA